MKITDLLETNFLTNEDEIYVWMKKSFAGFKPDKLTIESDGLVYDGNLQMKSRVTNLKVRFKSVSGYFAYPHRNIIDLEGCPRIVGRHFVCSRTNITSLKFCPQSINSTFYCYSTSIVDPREYRYALYSEIGNAFCSNNTEIDKIINTYSGAANRKHWPYAINLLSKVQL